MLPEAAPPPPKSDVPRVPRRRHRQDLGGWRGAPIPQGDGASGASFAALLQRAAHVGDRGQGELCFVNTRPPVPDRTARGVVTCTVQVLPSGIVVRDLRRVC